MPRRRPHPRASTPTELPAVRQREAAGFTLIELLVVVAIIASLIAILLPSMREAVGVAKTAACLSNQRQLAVAWRAYSLDYKGHHLPSWQTTGGWSTGKGRHWFVTLRPYYNTAKGVLTCPAVDQPTAPPSYSVAATASTPYYVYDTSHVDSEIDDLGAYAYNNWLEDIAATGWADAAYAMTRIGSTGDIPDSAIPVLGGGAWADGGWVRESDPMTTNHQNPGTGGPGFISRFALNRHKDATAIAMMDGSAHRVPYADLYRLYWHRAWK